MKASLAVLFCSGVPPNLLLNPDPSPAALRAVPFVAS